MEFPSDRRYTSSHEWLKTNGDEASIGITEFAQKELGELVFVNLPEPGDEVEAGESFADVESVKAVSEIISPVTGIVSEINEELLDSPELINQASNDAWFIKVESISDTADTLTADEYQQQYVS